MQSATWAMALLGGAGTEPGNCADESFGKLWVGDLKRAPEH